MISLDHIAIIVSSEESLQFYETLGFKESQRFERSYDTVVFMECGSITLEIFIDPKHPERVTDPEAKGLRHIAFTVESLEESRKLWNVRRSEPIGSAEDSRSAKILMGSR